MLIQNESSADFLAIDGVVARAFGGRVEADLVIALRAGEYGPIALVAKDGEAVVGHIMFCRLKVIRPDGAIDALALAPLAVTPAFQRRGIGSALVRAGLEQAKLMGEAIVFVLGDPAYYGRFGFSAELARAFDCVYACEAFQALLLDGELPGGMSGKVVYPPPFEALGGGHG